MDKLLNALGLMRRSEHEALNSLYHDMARERNDALILEAEAVAMFKRTIASHAKQADELNEAKKHIDHLGITFNQRLADEIQDYQADALLWRAARAKRRAKK